MDGQASARAPSTTGNKKALCPARPPASDEVCRGDHPKAPQGGKKCSRRRSATRAAGERRELAVRGDHPGGTRAPGVKAQRIGRPNTVRVAVSSAAANVAGAGVVADEAAQRVSTAQSSRRLVRPQRFTHGRRIRSRPARPYLVSPGPPRITTPANRS